MYGLMIPDVLLKMSELMTLFCMVLDLDNVYAVNLNHISCMHISCLKASLDDAWLWHRMLGHASMHTLHKLVKHDLVRGLPPYKYEKDRVCSVRIKVKQVCASFKSLKNISTSRCLELLQINLCGPIRI